VFAAALVALLTAGVLVGQEANKKEDPLKAVAAATKEQPYVNSLGMKFVPVPNTNVLFSIWETRVKDYEAFVNATGHKAEGGMYSLEDGRWKGVGRTWKDPGFAQTGEHPVCGVSWEDANAFCEWLTGQERKAERISPKQSYRLPTDAEWSAAVELEKEKGNTPVAKDGELAIYPWGTKFPPPAGAGNYAGSEAEPQTVWADWKPIEGYRDEYPRTSPVGSFAPNRFGIYDLGGNLWEMCQDWILPKKNYRSTRGASWANFHREHLQSLARGGVPPGGRYDTDGFRCVLVVDSSR
jgi:formylglycine-generating enzyme required for sulfatase activity